VIEPHEYLRFTDFFVNPEQRCRNAFCYIDARDLGQVVDLCIEKDGFGYQVFNAGNNTNTATIPSAEHIDQFFPGTPVTRTLGEHEALFSYRKIRQVLGFVEEHNWWAYMKD
jgi:nucleoside-diphosphate-sugar epimerase